MNNKQKLLLALGKNFDLFDTLRKYNYQITEEDYTGDSKKIFRAIKKYYSKGLKTRYLTEKMLKDEGVKEENIKNFLKLDCKDSTENFELYLEEVLTEKAGIKLQAFLEEMSKKQEKVKDYDSFLKEVKVGMEKIKEIKRAREGKTFSELNQNFSKIRENKGNLPTGLTAIDDIIYGLPRGSVTILSGLSGHGKTTLANQILLTLATIYKKKVLFLEIELKEKDVYAKGMGLLSNQGYQTHNIDRYDNESIEEHKKRSKLDKLMIDKLIQDRIIVKTGAFTGEEILNEIREAEEEEFDCIIVDYFQRVNTGEESSKGIAKALGELADKVSDLVNTTNIAFVWLSQLSNDRSAHPMEADIRWCKDMYQTAELELRVYREYEDKTRKDFKPDIYIGFGKNRFSERIEPQTFHFDGSTGRIGNPDFQSEGDLIQSMGFRNVDDWLENDYQTDPITGEIDPEKTDKLVNDFISKIDQEQKALNKLNKLVKGE